MTFNFGQTRRASRVVSALALLAALACDNTSITPAGDDGGNGGHGGPPVAYVRVSSPAVSLAIAEMVLLTAEPRDVNGRALTDRAVTWTSSNDAVASVSAQGTVTAKRAGSAIVRAIAEGKEGAVQIMVASSSVVSVVVTPTESSLVPGAVLTLAASAIDATGDTVVGGPVTWTTASPAVASVSADGRVTALAPGDARVFATIDGKFASALVHVPAPTIARFEIGATDSTIAMDEERQLVATAFDAQGRTVPTPYVQWSSSDPATVSITGNGKVTAIQPGMVAISARARGHVARTMLLVALLEWPADLVYLRPSAVGVAPRIRIQPLDGREGVDLALPAVERFAAVEDLAPSADGRRIAFTATSVSDGAVRKDIWVVERDGSGVRRLTTDVDAWESQPSWSPDGSRIAYRSTQGGGGDSDIWVMNADGSNQRNYTGGAYSDEMNEEWPAWSPDGGRIAYGALIRPTGHGELWMMNGDGAGKRWLTSDTSWYDWEPAWSPDGTQLAFTRVASMNGADVTILTVSGAMAGQVTSLPIAGSQLSPEWSPDGRYLAFASNHAGRFDIFTTRPDGRGLRQRTTNVVGGAHEVGWLRR